MSFRKRNIGLSAGADRASAPNSSAQPQQAPETPETNPGIRPSPDDGRPTTSTGSRSLDNLLAGHGGLPIGKTLLIEENGTTDFAGALLRYYAAEGVVQDQRIHVVGMPEQWGRSLPGLIGPAEAADEKPSKRKGERMKIAWRYERLGEFGAGVAGSRAPTPTSGDQGQDAANGNQQPAFCHAFDLTKRLTHPSIANITYVPLARSNEPFFVSIHKQLQTAIAQSPPNTVHRIIIPSLLNPTLYPPEVCQPDHLLPFLHSLRALMSTSSARITAMITLPLSLFPRSSGLVRWVELLSDGVIELCPFPHSADALATSGAATSHEEPPQGVLKTHRLPVLHERGGGSDQNIGQDAGGGGQGGTRRCSSRRHAEKSGFRILSDATLLKFTRLFIMIGFSQHIFHFDLFGHGRPGTRHCSKVIPSIGIHAWLKRSSRNARPEATP